MKEEEIIEQEEEKVITRKEELKAQIVSPAFNSMQEKEKKDLIRSYFEAHLEEKFKSAPEKVELKIASAKAHYDLEDYQKLENSLIKYPAGAFESDDVFKEMDHFADYIGSDSIQSPIIKFNPKVFKYEANSVLDSVQKGFAEYSVQNDAKDREEEYRDSINLNEPDKEEVGKADVEAKDELSDAMTADPSENTYQKTNGYYTKSLALFNTKRAGIFKQESDLHKDVREAAEDLLKTRKNALKNEPDGLKAMLQDPYDQNTKLRYAKQWLEKANKLFSLTEEYLNENDGMRLTFAGSDRKKGAKALKKLAQKELKECQKAIEESGLSLQQIYKDIAGEKVIQAQEKIEEIEKKRLTSKNRELTGDDRMQVYNAIHDALAGYASNQLICLKEDEKKKAGQEAKLDEKELKNLDFYSARRRIPLNAMTNLAILNYIDNVPAKTMVEQMDSGQKFIDALKEYNPSIYKVMVNVPKEANKQVPAKAL